MEVAADNSVVLVGILEEWARIDDLRAGREGLSVESYAKAALEQECDAVAQAPVGSRNSRFNDACFSIGTLIAAGVIDYGDAERALIAAAEQSGLEEREIKSTFRSGIKAGMQHPRDLSTIGNGNGKPTSFMAPPLILQPGEQVIERASSITPKVVEWLWPGRIPLGKLTTFAGVGGLGKTFVLCDLTARITRGAEWPFTGGECATRGQVLFISGEDDPDDTLVPRLIELGADLDRVTFLTSKIRDRFTLADLNVLSKALEQTGAGVRLVVIDPPTACLGAVDDHKNAELRSLLSPLASWASQYKVAIVFNTHVNKGTASSDAMMRVMGSVAWVNAVRAAHMFARDSEDREKRVFIPMKNNLGKELRGLSYKIVESGTLAKVEWCGEIEATADQAMAAATSKKTPRGMDAVKWLVERFREKPEWPALDLVEQSKQDGISWNAIKEAKRILDLPKSKKRTNSNGDWYWAWWVPNNWSYLQNAADN